MKSQKVTWLVLCLTAIVCASFVSYNIGYDKGDRDCRNNLVTMLDGLRMQCWDDLGQAKAQWKEIEEAEIKKGLPDWVIYESIKPKLEEIGAYGIEGKIYTRDNKKVVFLRDADMKEAQKLESEGNYVIVVSGGMKAPFLTDK